MKIKIDISNAWLYFIILFYIFSSYSVYVLLYSGTVMQLLAMLLSAVTVIMLLRRVPISKKIIMIPIIVMAVFCVSTFFSTNDTVTTLLYFIRFACIFWVVALYMKLGKEVLEVIYRSIFMLAIFYFACYLIFDILFPGIGFQVIRHLTTDALGTQHAALYHNYYNIYIRWATSYDLFGLQIDRMSGFCWEPGQYQMYLNFVLMYLLFFENNQKHYYKKIAFICVNIVLTTSAMGILIMVILFMIKLSGMKNSVTKILTFIPLVGCSVFFIIQLMVEKSINSEYSYVSRTGEFSMLYDIFFKNNILGESAFTSNAANAVIRFMWLYGYLAIAVIIILAVLILSKKGMFYSWDKKVSFGIWFLFSLFNEPIEFFNFTFLIVSIVVVGYVYNKGKIRNGTQNIKLPIITEH